MDTLLKDAIIDDDLKKQIIKQHNEYDVMTKSLQSFNKDEVIKSNNKSQMADLIFAMKSLCDGMFDTVVELANSKLMSQAVQNCSSALQDSIKSTFSTLTEMLLNGDLHQIGNESPVMQRNTSAPESKEKHTIILK